MAVNEEIEALAVERAPTTAIAAAATRHGMTSLRDDGLLKVRAGITSIDEILRVVV
jgi:type IV pilus assembly protein PilB